MYALCAAQAFDRLAYARNIILYTVAFHTSRHGSDLAKLIAAQVLRLLCSQGLVLNFQVTNTRRDGAAHASLLVSDHDIPETCAVAAMIRYEQATDSSERDLSTRYLFPEMQVSGDRTPNRLARTPFHKTMVAHFHGTWGGVILLFIHLRSAEPLHRPSQVRILRRLWPSVKLESEEEYAGAWEARRLREILL